MTSTLCLLLFLATFCHVALKEGNSKVWHHKLPYAFGDWQPHFGYVKSHMASDHKKRHHSQSTTSQPNAIEDSLLNDYVVRLYVKNKLICSGIVVSNRTVLTSSICLFNVKWTSVKIKLLDGTRYKIMNTTDDNEYTYGSGTMMVLLLILDKELPESYRIPPPICPVHVDQSETVELWSWNKRKTVLKKKPVKQISESECKERIHDSHGQIIDSGLSCVENPHITQNCEMTYGLPYVWKGHFCGLNIMGHHCLKSSGADVYVRLLQVKRYISRKLNEIRRSKLENAFV